jgi:hypothetical protein
MVFMFMFGLVGFYFFCFDFGFGWFVSTVAMNESIVIDRFLFIYTELTKNIGHLTYVLFIFLVALFISSCFICSPLSFLMHNTNMLKFH